MLALAQRLVGQPIDFVHHRIRHRKAPNRGAAAMHHDVGARAAERAIKRVGKANIERARMPTVQPELAGPYRIEALGGLAVALAFLGTQISRPKTDWIGGEELEA